MTTVKRRTCLRCGKEFWSQSAANRICRRCTRINAHLPYSERQLQKQRGEKRHNGEPMGGEEFV